jgi:hypothetical protein
LSNDIDDDLLRRIQQFVDDNGVAVHAVFTAPTGVTVLGPRDVPNLG